MIKVKRYTFRETTLVRIQLSPFEKGSILKGKNLLPIEANCFRLE